MIYLIKSNNKYYEADIVDVFDEFILDSATITAGEVILSQEPLNYDEVKAVVPGYPELQNLSLGYDDPDFRIIFQDPDHKLVFGGNGLTTLMPPAGSKLNVQYKKITIGDEVKTDPTELANAVWDKLIIENVQDGSFGQLVQDTKVDVNNINFDTTPLENKIDSVKADTTILRTTTTNIATEVGEVHFDTQNLLADVFNTDAKVDAVLVDTAILRNDTSSIETKVDDIKVDTELTISKVDAVKTDTNLIKGTTISTNNAVSEVHIETTAIKSELDTMGPKIDSIENKIDGITTSTSNTAQEVWDYILGTQKAGDLLKFLFSAQYGKWVINHVDYTMTFYDVDDPELEIAVFDLQDPNGSPTTTNIYRRIRR